jgi:hypothetical protein
MSFLKECDPSRRRNNRRPFPIDADPVTQDRSDAKHVRAGRHKQRHTVRQEQVEAAVLVQVDCIDHGDIGGDSGAASPILVDLEKAINKDTYASRSSFIKLTVRLNASSGIRSARVLPPANWISRSRCGEGGSSHGLV